MEIAKMRCGLLIHKHISCIDNMQGKYYKMTFIVTEVENSDGCCSRPARYAGKISLMEMLTDAPTTASAKKKGMGKQLGCVH